MIRFHNRSEAGMELARHLQAHGYCPDSMIVALPRGGVPVAFEIATALHSLVCKLSTPEHPELAIGAIAPDRIRILNATIIDEFMATYQQV